MKTKSAGYHPLLFHYSQIPETANQPPPVYQLLNGMASNFTVLCSKQCNIETIVSPMDSRPAEDGRTLLWLPTTDDDATTIQPASQPGPEAIHIYLFVPNNNIGRIHSIPDESLGHNDKSQ